jgi:2-keto-4-pentenoate hydratase/2-oxohepta-3-ene-1,7-dioic acid hydratase in catechol pathway
MAELARIEAEPLGELPEIYRKQPIYYITNRFSVRGTNTTVKWPRYSKVMDYELEFGIITKNKGANIPASKAKDHIFGYTIFNDFSARDAQRIEMEGRLGPAKGKSFDGGNVMGPWIVTPDEIGDPYKLKMEVRVNGKRRSQGVSEGMLFSFEEIIAHVTQDETLMPGEFIGSGTVGNGCGVELGWFLEHGDSIGRKNRGAEEQGRAPGRLGPGGRQENNRNLRGNAHGQTTDRYFRTVAERRAGRSAGRTSHHPVYRSPAGPAAHAAVLRRTEGGGSAGRAGLGGRAGAALHP